MAGCTAFRLHGLKGVRTSQRGSFSGDLARRRKVEWNFKPVADAKYGVGRLQRAMHCRGLARPAGRPVFVRIGNLKTTTVKLASLRHGVVLRGVRAESTNVHCQDVI